MKRIHPALRFALPFLLLVGPAVAAPTGLELMKQMDVRQKLGVDLTATVNMIQQKAGQAPKAIKSLYYRRDANDSFLIVMLDPEVERGNGYLRSGEHFWMYRQNTRSFQHISRDENIGSSDMRGGDFESRKFTELYAPVTNAGVEAVSETMLGKIPVYRIEMVAKVSDVTYPRQIHWLTRDNYLPLKVQNFSLSGSLMLTQYYTKYTQVDGRYVPVTGVSIDEFEKGNKTAFEISGVSFAGIDPKVFSKGYLESLSK